MIQFRGIITRIHLLNNYYFTTLIVEKIFLKRSHFDLTARMNGINIFYLKFKRNL